METHRPLLPPPYLNQVLQSLRQHSKTQNDGNDSREEAEFRFTIRWDAPPSTLAPTLLCFTNGFSSACKLLLFFGFHASVLRSNVFSPREVGQTLMTASST